MKQINQKPKSILLVMSIIYILFYVPGCISLESVPDTVQLEIEDALHRIFDGIIVYVDQNGDSSHFSAGWKN